MGYKKIPQGDVEMSQNSLKIIVCNIAQSHKSRNMTGIGVLAPEYWFSYKICHSAQ